MRRTFLFNAIAIVVFGVGAGFFYWYLQSAPATVPTSSPQNELSAASVPVATSTQTSSAATSTVPATTTAVAVSQPPEKAPSKATVQTSTTTGDEVARIQDPYSTPPESFDEVNTEARAATVNILCEPNGASSLDPISGSGVIIDPRGIILTNAHVAQFVLLSEAPQVDLQCVIRTGSPAQAAWTAVVLYIPPIWVNEHVSELQDQHPMGTGEHDYALLYITGSVNGSPLPSQFPYLTVDTRPAIAFPGDDVLIASYPAELLGGIEAQYDLYADTSITTVKELLTFTSGTPDLISLGGVIEAQSGSSGGAVVNEWGRLVGLVATTSSGTSTADRDLRAIALSYINSDLDTQSGSDLNTLLSGDPNTEVQQFNNSTAPSLIKLYIAQLEAAPTTQD